MANRGEKGLSHKKGAVSKERQPAQRRAAVKHVKLCSCGCGKPKDEVTGKLPVVHLFGCQLYSTREGALAAMQECREIIG